MPENGTRDATRKTIELPMDAWGKVRDALHNADEWSMDQAQLSADKEVTAHHAQNSGEFAAIKLIIVAQLAE
jgi:hypothetical protein